MSQSQIILDYLQEHPEGLHSFKAVSDMHILRAAARIKDLKNAGYDILSVPEKMGKAIGVRYVLEN